MTPSSHLHHVLNRFLCSGPAGALALMLILLAMPDNFPHGRQNAHRRTVRSTLMKVRRIDFLGALLLLAGSVLLVAALEEGGTQYTWQSPVTLSLLILSLLLLISFPVWEKLQATRNTRQEAVFPWRLATDRFATGNLLYGVLRKVHLKSQDDIKLTEIATGTRSLWELPFSALSLIFPRDFRSSMGAPPSMQDIACWR